MRPFSEFPATAARKIRFVLTDMDHTVTFRGRLSSATMPHWSGWIGPVW